ncbi:hypothetical protein PQX77_021272 [Marasmius sp. AFHP31]|nr:hypothetical protein PQX77_021272 [Marasmius sp. AFHP31]
MVRGPVVRVGPNQLDFAGSKGYDDIMNKPYPKDREYYGVLSKPNSDAVTTTCDPRDASKRRVTIGAYFSRQAVFRLEHVIQQKVIQHRTPFMAYGFILIYLQVDTLIHRISSYAKSKRPVDLTYAFRAASLDIITSYLFAQDSNALNYPDFRHPMILGTEQILENVWVPKYIPIRWDKFPEWIVRRLIPAAVPVLDQQDYLGRRLEELVQSSNTSEDQVPAIFDIFLHKDPGTGEKAWTIPRSRLLDECLNLQVAGTDTTSNACMIGTHYLLRDRRLLVGLQRELDEVWPVRDSPIHFEKLEKLPYLTGVIKESLRLSHGVVDPLPRIINRPGATIMGIPVPVGTTASSSACFAHTDPSAFFEPTEFRPERWLDPVSSRDSEKHLVAFSKGPRTCLGVKSVILSMNPSVYDLQAQNSLAWCELYLKAMADR